MQKWPILFPRLNQPVGLERVWNDDLRTHWLNLSNHILKDKKLVPSGIMALGAASGFLSPVNSKSNFSLEIDRSLIDILRLVIWSHATYCRVTLGKLQGWLQDIGIYQQALQADGMVSHRYPNIDFPSPIHYQLQLKDLLKSLQLVNTLSDGENHINNPWRNGASDE